MSNLEAAPAEITCRPGGEPGRERGGQLLDPRLVPLGGPRAMRVRRTLPQRARSLIGAWCFADHYGPDDVAATGGMAVAGHPHTGLQTASWLFQGEVEHRDTIGSLSRIRPGELHLMTAGAGIAHSEHSTPATTVLHGVQLWVALPGQHRHTSPAFEHHAAVPLDVGGAEVVVFVGSLAGYTSPARTYSPLLGAQITLPPGGTLRLDVNPAFEHGVLVDTGQVAAAGTMAGPGQLGYLPAGAHEIDLRAAADGQARVLLLGGQPLGDPIVMWWNFVARSHDEIAAYRAQWQAQRAGPGRRPGRFGQFPAQWEDTLPAPELPHVRLKPRG